MSTIARAFGRLGPDLDERPDGSADLGRDLRADMPWLTGQQVQSIVDRDGELRRLIQTFGRLSAVMWLIGTASAAALVILALRV